MGSLPEGAPYTMLLLVHYCGVCGVRVMCLAGHEHGGAYPLVVQGEHAALFVKSDDEAIAEATRLYQDSLWGRLGELILYRGDPGAGAAILWQSFTLTDWAVRRRALRH
jgi:hypothetical protein